MLTLRLLGPFHAQVDETPPLRFYSRKGQWLLALLALHPQREVARSWLAGTLWPDAEEATALFYLRRELTFVRKALGQEADRLHGSSVRTLRLDVAGAAIDVVEFDTAIAAGDSASLERATTLYAGDLLAECDEAWVIPEREAREQAYLTALEHLADLASVQGDATTAIRRLRAIVALDPLRETAQRALMQILAKSGDSAAAIQVYRDLRLYLRRELNIEADAETTALFHRIREKAPRPRPSALQTTPVSREPRITNIPHPLTPLIGRDQERWEIRRRLGSSRLLTLTGTGGVGKTRLAIEMAEGVQDDFAGGVCFVELAALHDASLVLQAVMDAFGLKQEPGRTLLGTLTDRLKTSDLLLVLDNCEHLLQPCAELVGSLLSACVPLRVLTTSREPLGITGESVWRVPSLSVPPALDNFGNSSKGCMAEVLESEAVTLFVERAKQARADFTLTTANVGAVSQVCRRLDGIPLAIELAAARVRSLTVEDINSRLDQQFRLLTGGSRTALPRHQTLLSLIDWSYDLLTASEKALFCRLAVFSGGWTLEAAEEICAGNLVEQSDVLDLLTSLSNKSLVVAETFGPGVRYRLLETIRQYAWAHLGVLDDPALWQQRHLTYFLTLAEQAKPHLMDAEQQAWFARLECAYDNLRTALGRTLERMTDPENGLRLCAALWWFWHVRGHYTEGRQWCERVLGHTEASGRTKARADVLHATAAMYRLQGDYTASRVRFEESLSLRQEMGDRSGIAYSLHGLGFVAADQGDYVSARIFLNESLSIHQETGNRWGIAVVLNRLGEIAQEQGDDATAPSLCEESLSLRREVGDYWGIADSLNNLGAIAYDQSDYSKARTLYELTFR